MVQMIIGSIIGSIVCYYTLMSEFQSKGKQAKYQCRVCKAYCPAKRCMRNYLKDRGVNLEKQEENK